MTRLAAVALGGLFYADGQAAKRGVAIGFVIPRGTGQVVFDVHGLEQRLRCMRSRGEAVQAIAGE